MYCPGKKRESPKSHLVLMGYLEAKEIGKVVSSITDNKLCTATRATELGCEYPSKYIGKRLVPKNVLTEAENLPTFMYSGG